MHNVTWFADTDETEPNPLIDQQIRLLDYFYLEFGINDSWHHRRYWSIFDAEGVRYAVEGQANGANFGLAGATADEPGKELAFAFAMLATDGNDFLGDDTQYQTIPSLGTIAQISAHR